MLGYYVIFDISFEYIKKYCKKKFININVSYVLL